MSRSECGDVAGMIDLHAAGACDAVQAAAVAAHAAACPRCGRALEEARRTMELLDVHFARPAALSRLEARLRAEARRPAAWPGRLAAAAALVLVTFGVGALLTPPPPVPLRLAVGLRPARPPLDAEVVRGGDLGKPVRGVPLPPRVDLELVMRNEGEKPVVLELGGEGFRCVVEVSGPGVRRAEAEGAGYVPFAAGRRVVEAGGELRLRLDRLASQEEGRVEYVYAGPGVRVVRVELVVPAWREGRREAVRLKAARAVRLR